MKNLMSCWRSLQSANKFAGPVHIAYSKSVSYIWVALFKESKIKITLEIDDQFFPAVSGAAGAQFMLAAITNNPLFFFKAADTVKVQGVFGVASEDR